VVVNLERAIKTCGVNGGVAISVGVDVIAWT
jgi:hypothetical protein